MSIGRISQVLAIVGVVALGAWVIAQEQPSAGGGGYEVHDMKRPQPALVTPAAPDQAGKPPSDAIVLFDGKDLSKWKSKKGGGDAEWKIENDYMEAARGKGDIQTKDEFGDVQLHIEWMAPAEVQGKGQGRGNSGVFLMGLYELQVIDSHDNETYPDGMAGSMYGQSPPLVNAARKPGEWQTYDVIFRAPKYQDGKLAQPARITVLLNGIVVQESTDLIGTTKHKALASYPEKHPEKGPISLQDHGNPVRFRNIWVRPLGEYDAEK